MSIDIDFVKIRDKGNGVLDRIFIISILIKQRSYKFSNVKEWTIVGCKNWSELKF